MYHMRREILEQPAVCKRVLKSVSELRPIQEIIQETPFIQFVGSGSSHHAAIVGADFFDNLTEKTSQAVVSSEFKHHLPKEECVVVLVSQSGRSADTLSCLKYLSDNPTVAVVNDIQSPLAEASDYICDIKAGVERSVTATKTYTAEIISMYLLTGAFVEENIGVLPSLLETSLALEKDIKKIVDAMNTTNPVLFLGSGYNTGTAFEAALKLTEAAQMFSEAFPAGEFLHGPRTLSQESTIVMISPRDDDREKNLKVLEKISGTVGYIVCLCEQGDKKILPLVDRTVELPPAPSELTPLYYPIPLQWMAYHLAIKKGLNPDRPRSLTKVVTDE